jgi:RNA polymerase sigma factor (sigma-70 family)
MTQKRTTKTQSHNELWLAYSESGSDADRNRLIEAYIPMICNWARTILVARGAMRYYTDACAEAQLRVLKAVSRFDSQKASADTFIITQTQWAVVDFLHRNQPLQEADGMQYARLLENRRQPQRVAMGDEDFIELTRGIGATAQKILKERYLAGKTIMEVGLAMGMSYYKVWVILTKTLRFLKNNRKSCDFFPDNRYR